MPRPITIPFISSIFILTGCQLFVDDADREVYRLIEERQKAALGETHEVRIESEIPRRLNTMGDPYSFVPHPIDSSVPASIYETALTDANQEATLETNAPPEIVAEVDRADSPEDGSTENLEEAEDADFEELDFGRPFTLQDALAYAIKHAWEYQDAKEDLYLQTLELTLERFLWTPQFAAELRALYTEYPTNSDPDRAMEAVADVAVSQRLPYGGTVVAQWIGSMVRDLENHVTNTESGTAILEANIPLLRGAGRVAYESRYQAERNLIYAVRDFERFRRTFLTRIASEYFSLLNARDNVENAMLIRESAWEGWVRAREMFRAERIDRLDADRSHVQYLQNRNRVVDAISQYEFALDRFKILIGMPTTEAIDVVELSMEMPIPSLDEKQALEIALSRRLDLLNVLDQVDDAGRGVKIAENNLLPDVDFTGSVSYATKEEQLNAFDFREDTETWNAGLEVEIPLQRKRERNLYRSSIVNWHRSRRDFELASDRVRLDVRQAMRSLERAQISLTIQLQNIKSNEVRQEAARIMFEQGKTSNRDKVEADNDLLAALNDYAAAQANLRQSILEFKLATGLLRVADDGTWSQ